MLVKRCFTEVRITSAVPALTAVPSCDAVAEVVHPEDEGVVHVWGAVMHGIATEVDWNTVGLEIGAR
jgi:hypothetical protein